MNIVIPIIIVGLAFCAWCISKARHYERQDVIRPNDRSIKEAAAYADGFTGVDELSHPDEPEITIPEIETAPASKRARDIAGA